MPFRSSPIVRKAISPSSRAWISRQFRDPYVRGRLSDPAAYRARSAFKLLEIDAKFGSFLTQPHVRAVVDLGAAPGGWSQVVAGKLGWAAEKVLAVPKQRVRVPYGPDSRKQMEKYGTWSLPARTGEVDPPNDEVDGTKLPNRWKRKEKSIEAVEDEAWLSDPLNIEEDALQGRGTIVAVDLLNIQPIQGVHTVKVDFLTPEAEALIKALFTFKGNPEGKTDIILSDMAANSSGNTVHDTESSLEICSAVFEFTKRNLRSAESIGRRRGGVLLLKHFAHPLLQQFRAEHLEPNFNDVKFIKPDSSRTGSSEGYWLCQGWKGHEF